MGEKKQPNRLRCCKMLPMTYGQRDATYMHKKVLWKLERTSNLYMVHNVILLDNEICRICISSFIGF